MNNYIRSDATAMTAVQETVVNDDSTLDEPLVDVIVDGTVIDEAHVKHQHSIPARPQSEAAQKSARFWRRAAMLSIFIIAIMAIFEGGRYVIKHQTVINTIESSLCVAETSVMLGSFDNRCTDPWEYVCGAYERLSIQPRSTFDDGQQRVNALLSQLLDAPGTSPPQEFWAACRQWNSSEIEPLEKSDPTWFWDRGLPYGGLQFGRTRSNESQYRYLTVVITNSDSRSTTYECSFASNDVCDGQLWAHAAQLGSQDSYDNSMCILGGSWQTACDRLQVALNTTDKEAVFFDSSVSFCLRETKRLWPTATSLIWEEAQQSADDMNAGTEMFEQVKDVIVSDLNSRKLHSLAKRIAEVTFHMHYVGPPEVYRARLASSSSVRALWEELLLEREAFDRSRLYFTTFDWDMPAHMVNAYYWPYSNAVYVTSAVLWWMLENANEAAKIGRLGMLLGHELGHAVHSNIDALNDVGARAAYNAGRGCLIDEYGVDGITVDEDMADRIAYATVGRLAQGLSTIVEYPLCNFAGCRSVSGAHFAFVTASQPFCATPNLPHQSDDPHSADKTRVHHSLTSTPSALEAWSCPAPEAVTVCNVVGASRSQ